MSNPWLLAAVRHRSLKLARNVLLVKNATSAVDEVVAVVNVVIEVNEAIARMLRVAARVDAMDVLQKPALSAMSPPKLESRLQSEQQAKVTTKSGTNSIDGSGTKQVLPSPVAIVTMLRKWMSLSQNQPLSNPKRLAKKRKTAKAKADPKDVAVVVVAVAEDVVVADLKRQRKPMTLMVLTHQLVRMSMKT